MSSENEEQATTETPEPSADAVSEENQGVPLLEPEPKGPVAEFMAYCRPERERRLGSDAEFDVNLYDEAVQLVVRKLSTLEAEGF